MKQKINEEWKLYAGNIEIFAQKNIVNGKLDVQANNGKTFCFIGSDPRIIKVIGNLLIEASEI